MPAPRVLLHFDRPELFEDLVRARFPGAVLETCRRYADLPAALDALAPEVVFLIKCEPRPYPREPLLACPSVRWISNGGVGIDHLRPWDPARVTVTNAAGVASEVMAWYVLGAIVALRMRLPHFAKLQAGRRWAPDYVGEVAGRTVTVLGLGHTGRAVAGLAAATGLRVVGTRARPGPVADVERVYGPGELHAALAEGDFVVVCVPLVDATRHLLDARAFAAMKAGAGLVDVSRGGVVDSGALLDALRSGHLAGAVLDVFEEEPIPPASPIWDLDNVLVTPHCSSVYPGWERRTAERFCDNLERWTAGEALENVVDPERGY